MDFAITKGPEYSAAGEPFAHAWTPHRKIGVRHASDKTIEVFVDLTAGVRVGASDSSHHSTTASRENFKGSA